MIPLESFLTDRPTSVHPLDSVISFKYPQTDLVTWKVATRVSPALCWICSLLARQHTIYSKHENKYDKRKSWLRYNHLFMSPRDLDEPLPVICYLALFVDGEATYLQSQTLLLHRGRGIGSGYHCKRLQWCARLQRALSGGERAEPWMWASWLGLSRSVGPKAAAEDPPNRCTQTNSSSASATPCATVSCDRCLLTAPMRQDDANDSVEKPSITIRK